MAKYKQVYLNFFDLEECDTIPSEISGEPAVDIHHIYPKGMGGSKTFVHDGVTYDIDDINNLIALTRKEHEQVAFKPKSYYWDIHQNTMSMHFV